MENKEWDNFFIGCDPKIVALLMSDKFPVHEKERILKQNPNYKELIKNITKFDKSILKDFENLKKLASNANNKNKIK